MQCNIFYAVLYSIAMYISNSYFDHVCDTAQ